MLDKVNRLMGIVQQNVDDVDYNPFRWIVDNTNSIVFILLTVFGIIIIFKFLSSENRSR